MHTCDQSGDTPVQCSWKLFPLLCPVQEGFLGKLDSKVSSAVQYLG